MIKKAIKQLLASRGLELRRVQAEPPYGSPSRPIGNSTAFLQDLSARGFRPRGLLDVGANAGEWCRKVQSIFPRTPALLIEPQREMEPILKALCREFPHCQYLAAGVGSANGELVQTIYDDLVGSTFLEKPRQEWIASGKQRITPIRTFGSHSGGRVAPKLFS